MRKHPPNRILLAGFVVAAMVLVGAGSLSALTRIFQTAAPLALGLTTGFHFVDTEDARSSEAQTANSQDSFSRSAPAPAWLMNAMPGYSSGRAREMWYLSLDRAGDRELRLYDSGATDVVTTNPYNAFRTDFATPSFQSSRAAVSSMALLAPSAPAVTGAGIISTT